MSAYPKLPLTTGATRMSEEQYSQFLRTSVESLMSKADKDKNRVLSFNEFLNVADELTHVMRRHEQRAVFEALDLNNDGTISRDELLNALKIVAPEPLQKNMSHQSYEAVLQADVDRMMRAAHPSKTPVPEAITFEEFVIIQRQAEDLNLQRALATWMRNANVSVS